jgi:hypothetical protein
LAILGLLPIRIRFRDLDLAFVDLVERVSDAAGPGAAKEILAKAEDVIAPAVLDAARTRVEEALRYERDVLAAVRRVAGPQTETRFDKGADALGQQGDRRVYIEVKSRLLASGRRTQQVIERFQHMGGRWLLVTDVPPSAWAARLLTSQDVAWVEWRGPTDDEALRRALTGALEGLPPDVG